MTQEKSQELTLDELFKSFRNGYTRSPQCKELVEKLKLNYEKLELGYNSGQLHHRKSEHYKQELLRLGIAKESQANSKTGIALSLFGSNQLIFPMYDEHKHIVNLGTLDHTTKQESFLYEHLEGIYPMFLEKKHRQLYLCKTFLDATTLISIGKLKPNECVIAMPQGKITDFLKRHLQQNLEPQMNITIIKGDEMYEDL